MMSKFLSSFLVLLLVCAICGCQTAVPGPSGYIELTEDEIQELINEARANAGYTGAVKKRQYDQQDIIFHTYPEVRQHYTADKFGKVTLRWKLTDTKTYKVVFSGELTDRDEREIKVSVTRVGEQINLGNINVKDIREQKDMTQDELKRIKASY